MSPQPRRPGKSDPKYMAQSAGWMGSSQEIMEYQTKLCAPQETHRSKGKGVSGPFLPPFDAPLYKRDGLWRNNVEFWSGGIQLWGGMCQIQRVFNLDNSNDFSKHLIYHASNNKQHKIDQGRLMQAQMLWTELHLIKMQLEQEFYHTK